MKAMILAAGRGQRMMPLTKDTPKPMLAVAGKPLLEHQIIKLAQAGIQDIVINHCYLGEQIENYFGDGSNWGVNITWSRETQALETAGGIKQALAYLGDEAFISINSDIWCDLPLEHLIKHQQTKPLSESSCHAHLVLVKNPAHNLKGDFGLENDLVSNSTQASTWTFSGIALYHPALLSQCPPNQAQSLAPFLRAAADKNMLSGEIYHGMWHDIGTPHRLEELKQQL
ncbi:N-acetylmuramate alpha-1-phosphate uridylyltransferase MurU [Aliikangiella sp. IMCC44653]